MEYNYIEVYVYFILFLFTFLKSANFYLSGSQTEDLSILISLRLCELFSQLYG